MLDRSGSGIHEMPLQVFAKTLGVALQCGEMWIMVAALQPRYECLRYSHACGNIPLAHLVGLTSLAHFGEQGVALVPERHRPIQQTGKLRVSACGFSNHFVERIRLIRAEGDDLIFDAPLRTCRKVAERLKVHISSTITARTSSGRASNSSKTGQCPLSVL